MLSNTIIAALAGLASSFGWGVGDFFAARASKDTNPAIAQLVVESLSAAIFLVIFLVFMRASFYSDAAGLAYGVGSGIFMSLSSVCFFRGLQAGPVSLVSPISAAYPLVTTVILLTVFHDSLNLLQLGGIALIVIGVMTASELVTTKVSAFKLSRGVKYALATALFWGVGYALLGPAIKALGWQTTSLVQLLTMALFFIAMFRVIYPSVKLTKADLHPRKNKFAIFNSVISLFAIVIFNFGVTYASSAAIVTAISASYPAITIFLALKQFKEEVRFIPLIGGFVSVIGVIILAIA